MSTEVTDRPERKRYEIAEDGTTVGYVTYQVAPDSIELLHTEVDRAHAGRGLAGIMVQAVLDDARSRHLAVIPHCPYVAKFIDEHREYLDLVPPGRRAQFGLDG
jgi:predicted GNAT family acetyltransferase